MNHICIDQLIEGFEDIFPELGVTHKSTTHESHQKVCKKFTPFIIRVIEGMMDENFIIDGFKLSLEELYMKFPLMKFIVFGYPNTTPEQKVLDCRKHDKISGNWTEELDDNELTNFFKFAINESKILQDTCLRLDIPFYDTSTNYIENIEKAILYVSQT